MKTPLWRGLFIGVRKMNGKEKVFRYFMQHDRGWILSLIALVFIVYLPFLGSPFVFDDVTFFLSSGTASQYTKNFFDFSLRWLPYASLAWTSHVFSDVVPHFFHLGNTLLHAGNVILLFYFLRKLLAAYVGLSGKQREIIWGAWFAAVIFAVHPVSVYAVGYIVQRSILMATFFSLVMQLAYIQAWMTGRNRWLLVSVMAYFMAGLSKEHSVMMPLVLFALHILFRDSNFAVVKSLSTRALWLCWTAFAVIAVLLVLRSKGVLGVPYEPMAAFMFEQQGQVASTPILHLLSALTQAGLFFKYLLLWLLPNPEWMSVDMREHFISSVYDWQGWAGGLAFIVFGVVAYNLLLRRGVKALIGLALLYPWLQFIVELTAVRVQEPFVLYRSYLWMPGIMIIVPLLLLKLPDRKMILALVGGILILLPLSWNRLWVFGDNYRLWNDAAVLMQNDEVAGADRIFFNRAQAFAVAHKWKEAAKDFERVAAISPQLAPVHYQLGMAYLNLDRFEDALVQFDIGLSIAPHDGRQYLGKGLALMKLHQSPQAQQQMRRGCELGDQTACMMAGFIQPKK